MLSPLGLLSFFYGLAVSTRIFFYGRGIFRTRSLPCKVVSVGNITLGGTGKTPFAGLLAELIRARGYRVAILSRGYKGNYRGPLAGVSDGDRILLDARQAGDEPALLAEKLKGVPVIIGKKRWLSGKYAVGQFRTEVVILDDGFQHLALKRDLNLLLIDASSPFGNGHLFPRGVLREPLGQISRADAVILTKVGQSANIKILKQNLKKKVDDRHPIFQVDYVPEGLKPFGEGKIWPPAYLRGKRILAFCGLAKPESFQKTLLNLETLVAGLEIFADHHWYTQKDLEKLRARAGELGAEALVTTEKDLIKMKGLNAKGIPLWAVSIRPYFPGNDQQQFEEFLFSRLGLT